MRTASAQKQAQHSKRTCLPGRGQCRAAALFCLQKGTQHVLHFFFTSHLRHSRITILNSSCTMATCHFQQLRYDKYRRYARPRNTVKDNSFSAHFSLSTLPIVDVGHAHRRQAGPAAAEMGSRAPHPRTAAQSRKTAPPAHPAAAPQPLCGYICGTSWHVSIVKSGMCFA